MLSIAGIPAEGCVDKVGAVECPKIPPRKPRDDSGVELGESLSVLATYSLLEEVVEELDSENVG
jgi:hypothetical protein